MNKYVCVYIYIYMPPEVPGLPEAAAGMDSEAADDAPLVYYNMNIIIIIIIIMIIIIIILCYTILYVILLDTLL